jgi:hypothetical protein
MRSLSSLYLVALACAGIAACDRPSVRVICHNSNCVEPTDPHSDDTIPALEKSLALQLHGKPAIDGTEIDVFWRAADDACLFAHDLESETHSPITEAADVLAAHFATAPVLTASGEPFRVFIELKAHVAAEKTVRHTPAQRAQHVACVWGIYDTIANAAVANGREIEIVFSSFSPDLLRDLVAQAPASLPVPYLLDAFYGVPRPLDSETRPLGDYAGLPIDIVEIHPQWIHDAQFEGLLSQDVEVMFWMFSATVETFAAIEQYEPAMVVTSEANLMRRWLEN